MKPKRWNLGYVEGGLSVMVNSILFGLQFWVGTRANSVSLKASAWHTLSDTLTSLIVIMGFWVASRKADREHPFGHGRAEVIAAVIIGTLLAVVGFNFMQDSVLRLKNYQSALFGSTAIMIHTLSILIKEALAQFSFWAGRKTQSTVLMADGWHHRSDAIGSVLIVAGALFGRYFWWLDGALGIMVSLLILYAAYDILKEAIGPILGESPGPALRNQLKKMVKEAAPMRCDFHHVHLHNYGGHKELTFHIKLPPAMNLKDSHEIATKLEERIRKDLNIEATIHTEPFL